jgi:hypothetical protein
MRCNVSERLFTVNAILFPTVLPGNYRQHGMEQNPTPPEMQSEDFKLITGKNCSNLRT